MVRYDPYTDSFIDNPTKEITATINLDAIPKDIIQINEVVEVSDESIEKIADAVVRKLADRKTENCSEFPNNCEHITEDGVTCAKYPACDDCLDNPLNKVKGSERLVKGKDEPQMGDAKPIPLSNRVTHIEDEPQTYITEDRDTQILDAWQVHHRSTTSVEDEPQTDCDHKCIQTEIGCEKTDCAWK